MELSGSHSWNLPPNQGRVFRAEVRKATDPDGRHPVLKDVSQNSHSPSSQRAGSEHLTFEDNLFMTCCFTSR